MKWIKEFPFIKLDLGIQSKLRDGYIWYDFYYAQGLNWYDKLKQPLMVLGLLGTVTYFKILPPWVLPFFVPVWFIGWLLVGFFIFKVLKIPQRQAIISGSKISPWEFYKMNLLRKAAGEKEMTEQEMSELCKEYFEKEVTPPLKK